LYQARQEGKGGKFSRAPRRLGAPPSLKNCYMGTCPFTRTRIILVKSNANTNRTLTLSLILTLSRLSLTLAVNSGAGELRDKYTAIMFDSRTDHLN